MQQRHEKISEYERAEFELVIQAEKEIKKINEVWYRKDDKNENPELFHYHEISNETKLELEINKFRADCYRLLLGDKYPEVKIVDDDDNKAAGVLQKFYPGYFTFRELVNDKRKITIELLRNSGIARIWTAAFLFPTDTFNDDNTGNGNQYGLMFNNNEKPVCIMIPSRKNSASFTPSQFPSDEVMQTEEAMNDMYETFLFRLMIPDETYENLAEEISCEWTRKEYIDEQKKIAQGVREDLISNTGFHNFIYKNKQQLQFKLIDHFTNVNNDYGRNKLINMDDINVSFDKMLTDIRNDWYFIFSGYHPFWQTLYSYFAECMQYLFGSIYQSLKLQNPQAASTSIFSFLSCMGTINSSGSDDDLKDLKESTNNNNYLSYI